MRYRLSVGWFAVVVMFVVHFGVNGKTDGGVDWSSGRWLASLLARSLGRSRWSPGSSTTRTNRSTVSSSTSFGSSCTICAFRFSERGLCLALASRSTHLRRGRISTPTHRYSLTRGQLSVPIVLFLFSGLRSYQFAIRAFSEEDSELNPSRFLRFHRIDCCDGDFFSQQRLRTDRESRSSVGRLAGWLERVAVVQSEIIFHVNSKNACDAIESVGLNSTTRRLCSTGRHKSSTRFCTKRTFQIFLTSDFFSEFRHWLTDAAKGAAARLFFGIVDEFKWNGRIIVVALATAAAPARWFHTLLVNYGRSGS